MSLFDKYIAEIIHIEGGYSDHVSDAGGKTMYGITEAVARKFGYTGNMKDLPLDTAKDIYRKLYWNPLRLDEISGICPEIVRELLDTGINQGISRAGEYLQTSLNALNRRQRDYNDIATDGVIGPNTLEALKAYCRKRRGAGDKVLLKALNCLQGAFYIRLSQSGDKRNEDFVYGWLLHRV